MGLAKLVINLPSLIAIILEESDRTIRLSSTEPLPEDSKIFAASVLGNELVLTLAHKDLPEPEINFEELEVDLLESGVGIESFEMTEDQQLRLDRYEVEMRNMIHLQSIAQSLSLKQFNKELVKLSMRVQAVMRHENPDIVIETAGILPLFSIERDDPVEATDNKSE